MASATGVANYTMAAANPLTNVNSMSSAQSSSAGSTANASTISANDFLTLLVTEMKNQDPTAATDPNEYINQLVQVNSLEQLIDINQNLSTALGISGANAQQSSTPERPESSNSPLPNSTIAGGPNGHTGGASSHAANPAAVSARTIPGNLSVPLTSPSAQRVGQALSGRN
jgi:flagellar basal-body rod modification protein FlgD